ncbi:hypothetical protein [Bacillus cereus]|uniref:hypothetical protein n=1 Tax=Bacillus cereus TaxID=1396 RepID=UPI0024BC748F|nr:hypothetical protein [Bacillus cereus]
MHVKPKLIPTGTAKLFIEDERNNCSAAIENVPIHPLNDQFNNETQGIGLVIPSILPIKI